MKKILLFALLCISIVATAADDVIILKNSTRIDAHLEEISDTKVRYKKANYLDGPTYLVETNQISLIILSNGDVINYANYQTSPTSQPASSETKKNNTPLVNNNSSVQPEKQKKSFDPTPSDRRTIGLTIGYMAKGVRKKYNGGREYNYFGFKGVSSGFQLGLVVQPEFKYGIGIKTGMNFEIGHDIYKGNVTNDLEVIDINMSFPLQLSYRMEVYKGLSLMVFTGPTFDFGLYASEKIGGTRYKNSRNLYQYTYEMYHHYQGFNCLWGIGAAIQYKGLRFTINGDYGMFKRNKFCEQFENLAYVDKPIVLSIGYMFNSEKSKK